MTPRLIKFMVELQLPEKEESSEKIIMLDNFGKTFFNAHKLAKVTIPVNKDL